MDHAGGMRAILAEGAVLVVGQGAAPHYRKALAAPMTRNPDMKPMDFSQVAIFEVPESHVMSDSSGRQVMSGFGLACTADSARRRPGPPAATPPSRSRPSPTSRKPSRHR